MALHQQHSYYLYDPSQPIAAVACGLFALSFLFSIYQFFRYRAWVWVFMVLACGMEAAGYGARIVSAGDTSARTVFIAQFCLIILSPVLMAGVIYVIFGRIVFFLVPKESRTFSLLWVPARFVTPIFVGFDVVALFLQLVGAVIVSGTQITDKDAKSKLQRGKDIALVGVTTQIVAFGLFTFVAVRFHFTSKGFTATLEEKFEAGPRANRVVLKGTNKKINPDWRRLLLVVNLSCALILIRSIYREVDFALGKESVMAKHEWYAYVFDALPMIFVVASYNFWHPGMYLPYMGFRLPKDSY